jgi:hypothetical protein
MRSEDGTLFHFAGVAGELAQRPYWPSQRCTAHQISFNCGRTRSTTRPIFAFGVRLNGAGTLPADPV